MVGFGAAPGDGVTEPTSTHGIPLMQQGAPIAAQASYLFRTIKSCEQSGSKKIPYITVC